MFSNLFSTLLISRKLDEISAIKKCQKQHPRFNDKKWLTELSPMDIDLVQWICSKYLEKYNYNNVSQAFFKKVIWRTYGLFHIIFHAVFEFLRLKLSRTVYTRYRTVTVKMKKR